MEPALTPEKIARLIDHSLLHPTLTDKEIREGCALAARVGTATVCVKPYSTSLAAELLSGTNVGVCAVAAFPHGNSTTALKVREAEQAVRDGAREIDVVVNIGKVLGGEWDDTAVEIGAINDAVLGSGALLKVIFEIDFLEDDHILRLCDICAEKKVAFVKTSTGYGFVTQPGGGYGYAGATEHAVRLMRDRCPPSVSVKAAGGIRTLDRLLVFHALGASRIGASATQRILKEAEDRFVP